ncbi:hypothetical protein GCM10022270_21110 [Terriglobus aquaticus]
MQRPASLQDQERSCREYAEKNGIILLDDHIYQDAAQSGTNTRNRPGFGALRAAMKRKPREFGVVLFDDTSRCARDVHDILEFVKDAGKRKTAVCFAKQDIDTSRTVGRSS